MLDCGARNKRVAIMSQSISNRLYFHARSRRGTKGTAASRREAAKYLALAAVAKRLAIVFLTVTAICLAAVMGHILAADIANPHMTDILQTGARLLARVYVF